MAAMNALPYDTDQLRDRAQSIIANVRELSQLGWTPATSSNFSQRLDERHAAITVSGRDKGRLVEADIMVVDFEGKAVGSDHRPSAETLLHTQLYRRYPEIGCVLHTHSLVQTVASRLFAGSNKVMSPVCIGTATAGQALPAVIVALLEVIVFVWIFRPERAWASLHQGADIRIPRVFKFVIRWVSPAFLTAIFAMFVLKYVAGWNLSFTAPLFITALAVPILKEPVGWRRWTAIGTWLVVAALYGTLAWSTWQMLEIVHDEKSPILQVPGSLTYGCVMAGLLMLGLLAIKSAWNAWTTPPVEQDPNAEQAVPEAHW